MTKFQYEVIILFVIGFLITDVKIFKITEGEKMNYKIVTDSSANILKSDVVSLSTVPMKIRVEDIEYVDDESINISEMTSHLKSIKTKSTTSCPSPDEYIEAFGDADRIFCTTITSNLSGSYNAAMLAKNVFESENPGKKVFVIDSLSAGPEITLIIEKLEELISSGEEYDDICAKITDYCKHTHLYFSLESLKNFANNGRVSPAVAKITGILGIRLVGKASDVGTLEPTNKPRGEKKAIEVIFENMKNTGYNGKKVIISHTENEGATNTLKDLILSEFPDANVKITPNRALCSFYAEPGGFLVGFEGSLK